MKRRTTKREVERTCLALFAAAIALSPATARAGEATTLVARDRVPAVAYVVMPKRQPAGAPMSTLIDALAAELEATSDLELRAPERAGIDPAELDQCRPETRLGCWSRLVSAATVAGHEPGPRWLFVVAARRTGSTRDVLSVMLIDLADAAALRAKGDDAEAIEAGIFARTVRTSEVESEGAPTAIRGAFAALLANELREALETNGHLHPYGAITLEGARPGATVSIDGVLLGTANSNVVKIEHVRPGLRQLGLSAAGVPERVVKVEVKRGETATAIAPVVTTSRAPLVRRVLFWSGLAAAGAGAVLATKGALDANDDVRSGCLVRTGDTGLSCAAIGVPTFGYDPARAPSTDPSAVNPSGVLVAPLGLALVATGATWAVGSELGDEDEVPWLAVGLGVVAAALTYGTGALLDPR